MQKKQVKSPSIPQPSINTLTCFFSLHHYSKTVLRRTRDRSEVRNTSTLAEDLVGSQNLHGSSLSLITSASAESYDVTCPVLTLHTHPVHLYMQTKHS